MRDDFYLFDDYALGLRDGFSITLFSLRRVENDVELI